MVRRRCCNVCRDAIAYDSETDFVAMDETTTLSFASNQWTFDGKIRPKRTISTEAFILTFSGSGSFDIVLSDTYRLNFTADGGSASVGVNGTTRPLPPASGAGWSVYVTPDHVYVAGESSNSALSPPVVMNNIVEGGGIDTTGSWYIEGDGVINAGVQMIDAKWIPNPDYSNYSEEPAGSFCGAFDCPDISKNYTVWLKTRDATEGVNYWDITWDGDAGEYRFGWPDCVLLDDNPDSSGTCWEVSQATHGGGQLQQYLDSTDFAFFTNCQCDTPRIRTGTGDGEYLWDVFAIFGFSQKKTVPFVGGYPKCVFIASITVSTSQSHGEHNTACAYQVARGANGNAALELSPSQLDGGFTLSVTGVEYDDSVPPGGGDDPFCENHSHWDIYDRYRSAPVPNLGATWTL